MPIYNRSCYYVTVKNNDALSRTFPHDRYEEAVAYADELRAKRLPSGTGSYKPITGQQEVSFLLRIREKGHPAFNKTFTSKEEAERVEQQIAAQRSSGLYVDYRKSQQTTATIMKRYIDEELADRMCIALANENKDVAKRKAASVQNDIYILQAMLDDSTDELQRMLELRESGAAIKICATRTPMGALYWLHKPFAELNADDIDSWMMSRLGDVATSTIWRQYEQFRAFVYHAINKWRYPIAVSPTAGVSSKKYEFVNDRNRLLKADEEAKLLEWARAYDRDRAANLFVKEQVLLMTAGRTFSSNSQRKHVMAACAKEAACRIPLDLYIEPAFEAAIQFSIMVGTRRSELLGLTWKNVDLAEQTAFIPMTKNGLPRTLPLRSDMIALLKRLNTDRESVFGLTHDRLIKAWKTLKQEEQINDLHFHDLRHEAITRVARTGKFTILDLQAFSGHKDLTQLQRYTHLCVKGLARRLDEVFQALRDEVGTATKAAA